MSTVDIVCTTIGGGSFLKLYTREIVSAEAIETTRIIVITDHKTDHARMQMAVTEARDAGIEVLCPSLSDQVAFMSSLGEPDMFPWNSDGRRNIGYLMAWQGDADIMISIDDDNLPTPGWLAAHQHALTAGSMPFVTNETGFFNPCSLLRFSYSTSTTVWARGFPYGKRQYTLDAHQLQPCDVVVNAGLWTGDPDVDAITRLAMHPQAFVAGGGPGPVVLGDGMWAPINSQNTAVRREAIPAYCYFESAKRFADIWQGYFVQACARHLGQHVRFGTPVTDCAVRNNHDLLKDLALEYDGIMMLDKVLAWLTEVELEGSTYSEVYESLRFQLYDFIPDPGNGLTSHERGVLTRVAVRMREWNDVIERLA